MLERNTTSFVKPPEMGIFLNQLGENVFCWAAPLIVIGGIWATMYFGGRSRSQRNGPTPL